MPQVPPKNQIKLQYRHRWQNIAHSQEQSQQRFMDADKSHG
ncbi:hypothetical protein GGQ85_003206 [Nitrobacter vulgaris]|nr:hypothetical protein [Nitrobacter vulgaris]